MKQLELTDELIARIKANVGEDVNLEGISVFEAITLNTKPLPGKKGTIWEGAVATPLTLQQIADKINSPGGHIPLISDHELMGAPKGRVFAAELMYGDDGEFEVRTLFYLDQTEGALVTKLNAGSLDEVSISFLPTQYQCSECDFDYLGEGANYENFYTRTCADGHEIGKDGVHVRMVGLAALVEVSLVARGAADKPKIVGRSASKLTSAPAQRLAAKGFELDGLVCRASAGVIKPMNTEKLTADLVEAKTEVGVLKAAASTFEAQLTAANTARDEAVGQVAELTTKVGELETQLAAATEAQPETKVEEHDAAVAYLTSVLTKLHVAAGETAENLPETVAGLTAAIDAKTNGLTALIPAGGVSTPAGGNTEDDNPAKVDLSAFKTNRR